MKVNLHIFTYSDSTNKTDTLIQNELLFMPGPFVEGEVIYVNGQSYRIINVNTHYNSAEIQIEVMVRFFCPMS